MAPAVAPDSERCASRARRREPIPRNKSKQLCASIPFIDGRRCIGYGPGRFSHDETRDRFPSSLGRRRSEQGIMAQRRRNNRKVEFFVGQLNHNERERGRPGHWRARATRRGRRAHRNRHRERPGSGPPGDRVRPAERIRCSNPSWSARFIALGVSPARSAPGCVSVPAAWLVTIDETHCKCSLRSDPRS